MAFKSLLSTTELKHCGPATPWKPKVGGRPKASAGHGDGSTSSAKMPEHPGKCSRGVVVDFRRIQTEQEQCGHLRVDPTPQEPNCRSLLSPL